ncbi:hypothetical protein D9758_012108 [Tetrapyrgos nigripes]|uniref:Flavin-containing monooxygenase n=1 Tax=Tetrapyrgos nigripes TaxID=182062 RepID=A0A8H5CNJ5_9AGAR|nr:hypothetical protein D9758_012108 [Tetrapyrgos nigripes]
MMNDSIVYGFLLPQSSLMRLSFVSVLALCSTVIAEDQAPFLSPPNNAAEKQHYEFKWPIKNVAVIGSGAGGLQSYRELTRTGFNVRIFERDSVPGGNWRYTEEPPLAAPVPDASCLVADYVPTIPPKGAQLPFEKVHLNAAIEELYRQRRDHRQPKPVWASLKSNSPAPIFQIPDFPWPQSTPWEVPRQLLERYVKSFASLLGVNSNDESIDISYDTRVELVEKRYVRGVEAGWTLTLRKFTQTGNSSYTETWWTEDFDAVVVATGRYNAPHIPSIAGLDEWAAKFPDSVVHSRSYRRPEDLQNKTVLIIGASTSAVEISIDVNKHAKNVLLSVRPDTDPQPHLRHVVTLSRVLKNSTVMGEIKRFHPVEESSGISSGKIELYNGTIISGVDHIIAATGFRYAFPFLPQYHNPSLGRDDHTPVGSKAPLITDCSHIRSLYMDIFYIEEPTLGFTNMNGGIQVFLWGDYPAFAFAKVWAGQAKLPSTEDMWKKYHEELRARGGYGKNYHFLGWDDMMARIRFFVEWLNEGTGRQINCPSASLSQIFPIWFKAHYPIIEDEDKSFQPSLGQGSERLDIFEANDW